MGFLDSFIPGVSALSSLTGMLGASSAARLAQQARDAAMADLQRQYDADYQNMVQNHRSNIYAATGVGGDAVRALGSNLGSALAGAGVFNSSATAGALANAANAQGATLATIAGQNFQAEQNVLGQGRMNLANMRLGTANSDLSTARGNYQDSVGGLQSFIQGLAQQNLAKSGANQVQASIPRSQGGYGNTSVLDLGAGLGNQALGHIQAPTGVANAQFKIPGLNMLIPPAMPQRTSLRSLMPY